MIEIKPLHLDSKNKPNIKFLVIQESTSSYDYKVGGFTTRKGLEEFMKGYKASDHHGIFLFEVNPIQVKVEVTFG